MVKSKSRWLMQRTYCRNIHTCQKVNGNSDIIKNSSNFLKSLFEEAVNMHVQALKIPFCCVRDRCSVEPSLDPIEVFKKYHIFKQNSNSTIILEKWLNFLLKLLSNFQQNLDFTGPIGWIVILKHYKDSLINSTLRVPSFPPC